MSERIKRIAIAILFALTLCVVPASAPAGFDRVVDVIIFTGEKVPSLIGTPVDRLALFVLKNDAFVQIPFQVDEKTPQGEYAFSTWLVKKKLTDDGLLDANDELSLMAMDLGKTSEEVAWPEKAIRCVKIEATDPAKGVKAGAYLFAFSDQAPKCEKDYVSFRAGENKIESDIYLLGYDPKAPVSINELRVKPQAGGSNANIADRMKIRIKATTLGKVIKLDRTEEDFNVAPVAYTDGPVRIVSKTRAWQTLFWNIPAPSSYVTSYYYRNQVQFPVTIDVPFDVSFFFKQVSMRVSVDSRPDVPGRRKYYNNHNPKGVLIDGKMSVEERNLNKGQVEWQVLAGIDPEHPEGWFARQKIVSEKKTPIELPLFYIDDSNTPDGPENVSGSYANVGFEFTGIEMVKKGALKIFVIQYPVINYKPGDENRFLDVDNNPLQIQFKAIKK